MQEHMYKVKLIFLSLTWVWLKFNFQLKNNAGLRLNIQLKTNELFGFAVQSRTQKPNSSLQKIQKYNFQFKKTTQDHMYKVKLILEIWLEFD